MRKFLLFSAVLFTGFSAFSQNFSNKGKDFWVAYGYHQVMNAGNGQNMVLYFATDQATNITITIPGNGYTQTITTPAGNNVVTSAIIPKTGGQDSRLLTEGLSNKGIHITSDKPMVAYAHIYNSNVSGATILFPTVTLGKEYFSINYKNISNSTDANCWFYVVAVDTGTTNIEITPSGATTGGWVANTTYTVTLTQGQVYNVMGTVNNAVNPRTGVDLTGSKIKSIAGGNGECKRIAVFSGSGRIAISCDGSAPSSDNYIVQAFPKSAWGKKFLTIPAAGNQSNNIYRVCVSDPATVVNIDGVVGGYPLQGNFYYEIPSSSQPHVITADKPICVSQYFTCQSQCGNGTPGDPEVIYLSPVEQNISKVLWNATPNFNITNHYFNVVIPNAGTAVSSFRLDGAVPVGSFTPHPQDANYVYLRESVSAGPHVIQSDSGFNAIAYGFGNFESYGYNAGTNVRNLGQKLELQSQYGLDSDTASICCQAPFKFKVYFPDSALVNSGPNAGTYQLLRFDSLRWEITPPGNIVPNNFPVLVPGTVGSPPKVAVDSINIRNGLQVAWYSLPTFYTITAPGLFKVKITTYGASASECGGTTEDDIEFDLDATLTPVANFYWQHNGCVTDSVKFFDSTIAVRPLYKWWWDFGEPASGVNNNSILRNPVHKYTTPGTYTVRFVGITTAGCITDTLTKQVTVTLRPDAKFGMSSPICAGKPVTFSDSSLAYAPGVLAKWIWDFGNGTGKVTRTVNTDTTVTYSPWNSSITDTLWVETNSGCRSLPFTKTFKVNSKPVSNFTLPAGICLPDGNATFPITSTNADPAVQVFSYLWNYGDPASGVNNTGTTDPGTHFYAPPITTPYNVQLITTTSAGCSDTVIKPLVNVFVQEHAAFTVDAATCLGTATNYTDISVLNAGITAVSYGWDWGDGSQTTVPTVSTTHTYAVPGTYTVRHWLTTDKGCQSDTVTQTTIVNPIPIITSVTFTNPTTCSGNQGTITLNGLIAGQSYTVNFSRNGTPQAPQSITANGSGQVVITGLTAGSYSNINVTANACTSANAPTQVLTDPPLPAAPTPGSNSPICSGNTLNLTATAVAGASGYNWTGPNSFASTLQNPSITGATAAATGVYTVTVTVNNCTSLASVPLNVVVNQTPAISSVTNTNPTTCAGNDGTIILNGLTAGQSYSVSYDKNAVAQAPVNIVANGSGQVIITGLTAGTYSNINVTANACTSANAATQILSDPNPPAAPTTGSNSPVCAGSPLNLTASAVAGGTYSWTGPNGFTSASQNPTIASPTTAATGIYLVTVTVNNCTSNTSIPLNVVVNVTPAISSVTNTNPTTCLGNEGTITLNGLLAGQSYTVNFSKNGTPQAPQNIVANASGQVIITGLTAGTYSNINVLANGCTSANAATQVLTDPPLPNAPTPGSNSPICSGNTLNLTATTVAGASGYNWTGPNSFASTLQNPSITGATTAATGVYTVTVTVNNCTSLASIPLNVVVNQTPSISSTTPVNPSTCAGSDGSITLNGLTSGQSYTVNYEKNAVAQPPLNLVANGSGQLLISGLTAGTYSNITCTANACTSAPAATVILSDPSAPAAPSAGSNSPLCTGATINLTAGAVANATYTWSGPAGFNSAVQNPAITNATVAMSGNYSVTVTVANCVSAATIVPVTVHPLPTANFNFVTPSCATRDISFTDVSVANVGTLNAWSWDFGDPGSGAANTSSLQNPTHTFATTGTFVVSLIVTNSQSCVSTVFTRNVTITARPQAGFIIPEVCLSDTYAQFTDTSKIATGETITGWLWNFGDPGSGAANTSSLQNPQHSYTAVGNYNVQLIAISANGCRDTITQILTVNGSFPNAVFTVNNTGSLCSNDSVSIVNNSNVFPGVITKVEIWWDNIGAPAVKDVDDFPVAGKIYKHKYPTFQAPLTRNYQIKFRAYSGGICLDDSLYTITVNATPKVQFNAVPPVCLDAAPFSLTPTYASEIGGVPGTGTFSGTGVNGAGVFNPASAGPGTYNIRYTYVATAAGCTDTISRDITVLAPAVADFTVSTIKCEKIPLTFDASSSAIPAASGTIASYRWNFGDGSPVQTVTTQTVNHTFTSWSAIPFNVTLQVITSNGCVSAVKTIPVTISSTPTPAFTIPASLCIPNANAAFPNISANPDGSAMTYLWNYGEPSSGALNTGTSFAGSHWYSSAGPFNVNLQATSSGGCVHDTTIVLNTIHPQPKADFSINKPSVCIGQDVSFTDLSTGADGTITQWNWSFGDGVTSGTQNPLHLYGSANTFNVSLYIVNSVGCNSDTVIKQFNVYPYPVVDAGPDRVVLEGGSIVLQPIVTGNNLQYLWTPNQFMNDNRSGTPTVSNILNDITYTLVVTAQGGCSASDKVLVKLLRAPRIPNTFTPNNDGINDTWIIEYLNTYPSCRVQVFTRTGQLVFESKGYGKPWDGTKTGKTLPFDTYYYIIEPGNGRKPITGYVQIVK